MKLRPFFSYFGSKWRLTPKYPEPKYKTIIEPFAGAAGYACNYSQHDVVLVELDPMIAAIWRYLIKVTSKEILKLPLMLKGQTVEELKVLPEVRALIGFCLNIAACSPARKFTPFSLNNPSQGWGEVKRQQIADQVRYIRHWRVIEGDYTAAPEMEATWFIDPPYKEAGSRYRQSSINLDFPMLGRWCRRRQGQVMVCENEGATWLPFKYFSHQIGQGKGAKKHSEEVWWYRRG